MDKKTNTAAVKPAEADDKSKKVRRAPKKKVCAFCTEKNAVIDYKDVNRLKKYITENLPLSQLSDDDLQERIEAIVEDKIKELEDKLNENQCLTDLKNEQNTNEDLNNKLNNYVLKITSNRIFDITMIVLFLLLLLYVIFKNQKPKK